MASTFKSFIAAGVGTTEVVGYTAPSNGQATIIGLSLANTTSAQITASVRLQKPGPVYGYLVKDAIIPPGQALAVVGGDQKVVAESNNTIRISASALGAVDVVLSVLELV